MADNIIHLPWSRVYELTKPEISWRKIDNHYYALKENFPRFSKIGDSVTVLRLTKFENDVFEYEEYQAVLTQIDTF